MNILEQIVADKKKQVEEQKSLFPTKLLEQSTYFTGHPVSMVKYLRREDKVGIIAEIKRKSPSKGTINQHVSIERTSIGYMQAGASGLSILTDEKFFGGKTEDLTVARNFNFCPILRKDFIIDEYQIVEAKSIGADVILLIAAILKKEEIERFSNLAKELEMEVLLEVHNAKELNESLIDTVDMVGVNNRDLTKFETNVNTSKELASKIPNDFLKISESGLNDPQVVVDLMGHGYEGFLIGEYFMQNGLPAKVCGNFIRKIKEIQKG